jgi:hypothetical protein
MLHATPSSGSRASSLVRVDRMADGGAGWATGGIADPWSLDLDNRSTTTIFDPRGRQIRQLRAVARRGARLPRLAEGGNDMLGEELHLAHLFVERHEALVEEPAEPFELTMAANLVQRLNLVLHLVDRAG